MNCCLLGYDSCNINETPTKSSRIILKCKKMALNCYEAMCLFLTELNFFWSKFSIRAPAKMETAVTYWLVCPHARFMGAVGPMRSFGKIMIGRFHADSPVTETVPQVWMFALESLYKQQSVASKRLSQDLTICVIFAMVHLFIGYLTTLSISSCCERIWKDWCHGLMEVQSQDLPGVT
jgi:hypothetical protein